MITFKHSPWMGLLIALSLLAPNLAAQQPPAPVVLGKAEQAQMAPSLQVSGTVVSRSDAVLSAEVEGRLLHVAEVGSRVATDDILAEIEDVALRLRETELAADVQRIQSRLRFLEAEQQRLERLAERDMISFTEVDRIRSERATAAGEKAVSESRLAQVRHQLERSRIRAPFPGVVAERRAQAGERVGVGTPVIRLLNPESLEIVARAPLAYYRFQEVNGALRFVADGEDHDARLRTLVTLGAENRHVFEMRLDLEPSLPVGQTVRVSIPTAEAKEVLAVPRDALVLRSDGISVFVVNEDNSVRRARVTTGIGSGDRIEIRGPVQAGDRIVIRGAERLRDGQMVAPQG